MRESFTFAELSEQAKSRARDHYREQGQHDQWWDAVYEDAVTIGALIGIEIEQDKKIVKGREWYETSIWFRGFSSQGDGCCYDGKLHIDKLKGCVERLREHTGVGCTDDELFKLAARGEEIYDEIIVQRTALRLDGTPVWEINMMEVDLTDSVTITGSDRYSNTQTSLDASSESIQNSLDEYVKDFADWIYKQLEAEDEHLNSDETIDEYLDDSEDTYDEDGNIV